MTKNSLEKISDINTDICLLFQLAKKTGWRAIKINSVHRMMYLISVLFTFKYNDVNNPFLENYTFSIKLQGPYSPEIDKSLSFLETNDIINSDNNLEYQLIDKNIPISINESPNYILKNTWIETILFIISIYGEDSIYDFIFEDPEYQYKLLSNTSGSDNLNISKGNETTRSLESFKKAFESSLKNDIDIKIIDNQKYLSLYFDYVFSKIIKGE